eukprot:gene8920-9872_t
MSKLYQSTTESIESLDTGPTCAPPLPCKRRKAMEKSASRRPTEDDVELGEITGQEKTSAKQHGQHSSLSCLPGHMRVKHRDPRETSSESFPGKSTNDDMGSEGSLQSPPVPKRQISRAKSVRMSLARNTLDFFGLYDPEIQAQQKKWDERRIRHCSKRYGKLKEEPVDSETAIDAPDAPRKSIASVGTMNKTRLMSKRESVPSMVFNGLKRRLSTKPSDRTHSVFFGRSFAPKDLQDEFDEEDEDDLQYASQLPQDLRDSVFFDFHHNIQDSIREEPERFDDDFSQAFPEKVPAVSAGKAVERDKEIVARQPNIKDAHTHITRQPSERRHRLQHKPVVKKRAKTLKRKIGSGFIGNLLNRKLKKKPLSNKVKKQMEELSDHRPYFTYYVSFVQLLVLIVMVSVYSFAPVGTSKKTVEKQVIISRNGKTQYEVLQKTVFENFWIGPSQEDLIRLGAKYAPCMRRDKLLFETIRKEIVKENKTGCCTQTYYTGCIQTSREECMNSFAKFVDVSPKSGSKAVCGQDPAACTNPVSVEPHPWPPNDITKWPICKKTVDLKSLSKIDYPHLRCEVTGRPCCVGIQAKCIITSIDHCNFLGGRYHDKATLCSQVDCAGSICGLLPFLKPETPDQVYRLWLSLFLHAGIIHLILTLIFNFTILRDMEKMAGWVRIAVIYLVSGIGGNLWSSVLIPYQVEVGPSGALFGIIACLFVELFQTWQLIVRPFKALLKLSVIVLALFIVGLLPYVDNFAHIFGFLYGLCSSFAFLPYLAFGKWDLRRKRILVIVSLILLVVMSTVGAILFYVKQEFSCPFCEFLNCVPLTSKFCENSHKGQYLQQRS